MLVRLLEVLLVLSLVSWSCAIPPFLLIIIDFLSERLKAQFILNTRFQQKIPFQNSEEYYAHLNRAHLNARHHTLAF